MQENQSEKWTDKPVRNTTKRRIANGQCIAPKCTNNTSGGKIRCQDCADKSAKLLEENIRLVYKAAGKMWDSPNLRKLAIARGETYDDFVTAGKMGIIKAADYYDESRGYAFSTFAFHCVKTEILSMITKSGMIRLPPLNKNTSESVRQSRDKIMQAKFQSLASVEDSHAKEEEPFKAAVDSELSLQDLATLRRLLKLIPPQKRAMIEANYGLNGQKPISKSALAAVFGVSKQRVSSSIMEGVQRMKWYAGKR